MVSVAKKKQLVVKINLLMNMVVLYYWMLFYFQFSNKFTRHIVKGKFNLSSQFYAIYPYFDQNMKLVNLK
jgi:hypothetical protein